MQSREVLIFSLCALRSIDCGIMACIFFEILFIKGMVQMYALKIQLLTLAGQLAIALLITYSKEGKGITKWTVLVYVIKAIAAYLFMTSHNFWAIAGISIFSLLPVTGNDSLLLEQMELQTLHVSDKEHFSNLYQNVKKISHIIGAFIAFFYYATMDCRPPANYLPYLYVSISILELLLAFSISLQTIDIRSQAKPSNTIPQDKSFLITGVQSFSQASLTPTCIAYFLNERYPLEFHQVCFIIVLVNLFDFVSVWVAELLTKWFGNKFMMLLKLFSNVFFILMITTLARSIIVLGIIFFVLGIFFSKFDKVIEKQMNLGKKQCETPSILSQMIGILLGIAVNWLFMRQISYSYYFAFPILISGVLRMTLDLLNYRLILKKQSYSQLQIQPNDIEAEHMTRSEVEND